METFITTLAVIYFGAIGVLLIYWIVDQYRWKNKRYPKHSRQKHK